MLRGIVYSFIGICLFLLGAIIVVSTGMTDAENAEFAGGWILLVALFLVAPVCFGLGYWHHLRLNPKAPRWDSEMGQ